MSSTTGALFKFLKSRSWSNSLYWPQWFWAGTINKEYINSYNEKLHFSQCNFTTIQTVRECDGLSCSMHVRSKHKQKLYLNTHKYQRMRCRTEDNNEMVLQM